MRRPKLSVVVIGLNEGERLERCLSSIRAMHFPQEEMELIYVDSGSTDGSVEKACKFGAQVIQVKPKRHAAGIARNAGWRASSAPFVLFVDGDSVLHPDFVARGLREFADPKIAVVFGSVRELHPKASVYHRVLDVQWHNPRPGPATFCGGNALVRRSALEQVNGYDPALERGEDPDMCWRMRRLGLVIFQIGFPMVLHDLAMTQWSQYWRRSLQIGYHWVRMASRMPGSDHFLIAKLRLSRIAVPLLAAWLAGVFWAAVELRSFIPVGITFGAFSLLILKTAWGVRRKAADRLTPLLYAIHYYVVMAPLFAGQALFWYDTLLDRERRVSRYK